MIRALLGSVLAMATTSTATENWRSTFPELEVVERMQCGAFLDGERFCIDAPLGDALTACMATGGGGSSCWSRPRFEVKDL